MQNNGSILYDYQQGRSAGRRRVRRVRTYTLEQAITPKTCGLLPGSSSPVVRDFSETKTARGIYIVLSVIFIGVGIYSMLF
ncbi:MAG: hypothetical protein IKA32_12555 [Lentisphaeria bacterium]|nr:hypothetical protein [Lentisphaeria bacterium]